MKKEDEERRKEVETQVQRQGEKEWRQTYYGDQN